MEMYKLNKKTMNDFTTEENKWLKVLSKDKNYNEQEFLDNYLEENEIILSIFKYRNYLINKQNVDNIDKLKMALNAICNKNYDLIKEIFEVMFLEPLSEQDINIMIYVIKTKEILSKIIQLHNIKKTNRLMSILTRL